MYGGGGMDGSGGDSRGETIYIYVTECSVCVSGYYPLTFLPCPFSFLIGWEFYGSSYLKC